ncbi:MAG: GNAT family N-acetyltransferase [Dehalococcoidia bacterium]|jgi:ribosomal protein S18 acetylase RimI-like enzyme|nr:GNAT family N-acetyltransferase [Dehalococcoidia bacterium]
MQIRPLTGDDRTALTGWVTHTAGSPVAVTPLCAYDIRELDGFVAADVDGITGVLTCAVERQTCEIVTIDALQPGRGIGAMLLDSVRKLAVQRGCKRLTLFTTNDNLQAQRFFERHGFRLAALYPDAMDAVRQIKPKVPATGDNGIPLRDMIRYELKLRRPEIS